MSSDRDVVIDVEPVRRGPSGAPVFVRLPDDGLKTWGWFSYLLHLIVALAAVVPGMQVSVALLAIALVIDLVKREDAAGTWQQSHFSWRIRSVLWAGVAYILTSPLHLLLWVPGAIAWGLVSLWFLYRIVKGMVRMSANRPVDA